MHRAAWGDRVEYVFTFILCAPGSCVDDGVRCGVRRCVYGAVNGSITTSVLVVPKGAFVTAGHGQEHKWEEPVSTPCFSERKSSLCT
jgi:hypothetical protein